MADCSVQDLGRYSIGSNAAPESTESQKGLLNGSGAHACSTLAALPQLDLCAEPEVLVANRSKALQRFDGEIAPGLSAVLASRDAGKESGLPAPGDELLQGRSVQQVTQVVRGNVGVGRRAMCRQAKLMDETFRMPLVAQHLVREPQKVWPDPEGALPGADPIGPAAQGRATVALLETCAVGCERDDPTLGSQDRWRNRLPERRVGDVAVQNVVDRHGLRRDRPPRIDEVGAAVAVQTPVAVLAADDVLPPDLADVVGAVAGGLQVYDADAGRGHR